MPLSIRISHYSFPLSSPFEPGHQLSEAEAAALNALRAENIRNLLSHHVRKAQQALPEGKLLSEEALEELRSHCRRLDAEYRFGQRRSVPRQGTIEKEAQAISRGFAAAALRSRGEEPSEAAIEEEAKRLAESPAVLAEARRRVEESARVATAAIADLI